MSETERLSPPRGSMWIVAIGTGIGALGMYAAVVGDRDPGDRLAMFGFFLGIALMAGSWLLALLFPRRCGNWIRAGIPLGLLSMGGSMVAGGVSAVLTPQPTDSGNAFIDGVGVAVIGGVVSALAIAAMFVLTATSRRGTDAGPEPSARADGRNQSDDVAGQGDPP